jgi:hypothetical protein
MSEDFSTMLASLSVGGLMSRLFACIASWQHGRIIVRLQGARILLYSCNRAGSQCTLCGAVR